MNDRLAVLVIHGMGSQKPYETLDEFARGMKLTGPLPQRALITTNSASGSLRTIPLINKTRGRRPTSVSPQRIRPPAAAASHPALIDVSVLLGAHH